MDSMEPELEEGVFCCPRVNVSLNDVEFLYSLKLSLTKIAGLLSVSRSTIYRRMIEGRVFGGLY